MADTSSVMDKIRALIDSQTRGFSRIEYREFLDELGAEVDCREMALDEDCVDDDE